MLCAGLEEEAFWLQAGLVQASDEVFEQGSYIGISVIFILEGWMDVYR